MISVRNTMLENSVILLRGICFQKCWEGTVTKPSQLIEIQEVFQAIKGPPTVREDGVSKGRNQGEKQDPMATME